MRGASRAHRSGTNNIGHHRPADYPSLIAALGEKAAAAAPR